jgi:Zn-dependent protease with chaperone function
MFQADYFDGRSSTQRVVVAAMHEGVLRLRGQAGEVGRRGEGSTAVNLDIPREALKLQSRIGDAPPRIELADGGLLVCYADYAAVSAELGGEPSASFANSLAHRLESNLAIVFASFAGVILAGWLAYSVGIPWTARQVAERIPVGVERDLGRYSMESLDKVAMGPSKLDATAREEVMRGFRELVALTSLPKDVRLEFRDGGWIGANALALPGQIVVVTDQLVTDMQSTDRVLAVLAHELGHVERRHATRRLLETSFTGLLAFAVWGDASSVAAAAASVPTTLMHAGHSRDAESEADAYAFDLLRRSGRSPALFAEAIERLAHLSHAEHAGDVKGCAAPEGGEKTGDDAKPTSSANTANTATTAKADEEKKHDSHYDAPDDKSPRRGGFGYLSTHPEPEERARRAREAAAK